MSVINEKKKKKKEVAGIENKIVDVGPRSIRCPGNITLWWSKNVKEKLSMETVEWKQCQHSET